MSGPPAQLMAGLQHRADSAEALPRMERVAWILFLLAAWMLFHLYQGLRHDAIMYTMQGLAHIDPGYWQHDAYLRFGSQDQFSLFPRLYSLCIKLFGLEPAAELLTGVSEAAFFLAAWYLARQLLPERQALAGIFLLITLPITYGSTEIFHVVEDFVTPRLLAEALVLVAIALWLRSRRWSAVIVLAFGLTVHPLMTAGGIALLLWLGLAQPKPRLTLLLALLVAAALGIGALLIGGPPLRFDDFWYWVTAKPLVYLLVGRWNAQVWTLTLLPLVLLASGAVLLEREALRRLAQAGLGIGIAGIALAAYGGDWLRYSLILQGQPWRCLWVSGCLAVLLLPAIAQRLWQHSDYGRALLLTLLAQQLLATEDYGLALSPLALLFLLLALRHQLDAVRRYQRLALLGSALILGLALFITVSDQLLTIRMTYFPHEYFTAPTWVKRSRELLHNGLLIFALLAAFHWALAIRASRRGAPLLVAVCAALCCALVPITWEEWSRITYTSAEKQLFASWRSQIPPGTEVLFPENPLFTWVLLERPSYFSGPQAASGVFARPAAMFLYGRAEALRPYLRYVGANVWDLHPKQGSIPKVPTLELACGTGDMQFVASRAGLDATPLAEIPITANSAFRGLKLYACPRAQS